MVRKMEPSSEHNPWIPIADLLAGFVFVFLLMFVTASLRIMWLQEKQRAETQAREEARIAARASTFDGVANGLKEYENRGLIGVDRSRAIVSLTDLSFERGSACLSPAAKEAVTVLAERLTRIGTDAADVTVYVEGHTDPTPVPFLTNSCGWFENNIQLATLRAANVQAVLLGVTGAIWERRTAVAGYGSSRLLDDSNPTAAINRRVELRFVWPDATAETAILP
jgi:chemotaxis protein MotB